MVVNAAQQDPCSSLGCYTTGVANVSNVAAYSADGCLIRVYFKTAATGFGRNWIRGLLTSLDRGRPRIRIALGA